MGYKTEINYILKSSSEEESNTILKDILDKPVGFIHTMKKSGFRTYVLGSPIMLADNNWNIIGMCLIQSSNTSQSETVLHFKILSRFSQTESQIVSRLIQEAEIAKDLITE